jgi:hypothetical protein
MAVGEGDAYGLGYVCFGELLWIGVQREDTTAYRANGASGLASLYIIIEMLYSVTPCGCDRLDGTLEALRGFNSMNGPLLVNKTLR